MPRSSWRDGWALLKSLFTGVPFLIARDWVPGMAKTLDAALNNSPLDDGERSHFDYIHADQLWMAPYALSIKSQVSAVNLVLDQHNAVHLIPERLSDGSSNPLIKRLLQREARLMAKYEAQTCAQFDNVVWVTDEDREAVNRHSSIVHPQFTIPICIAPKEVTPVVPLPGEPTLLFLGGMHWPPNAMGVRWFLEKIWPLVKAQLPTVILNVIGKDPPSLVKEIDGVHAPGYVEDLKLYWGKSRVFIVPLRAGGGMRVKILDAWARGLPVVSTAIGAEGIEYNDGEDILIADNPREFCDAVLRVLQDDELAQRLAQGGRTKVETLYDWRTIYQDWDGVYPPV